MSESDTTHQLTASIISMNLSGLLPSTMTSLSLARSSDHFSATRGHKFSSVNSPPPPPQRPVSLPPSSSSERAPPSSRMTRARWQPPNATGDDSTNSTSRALYRRQTTPPAVCGRPKAEWGSSLSRGSPMRR